MNPHDYVVHFVKPDIKIIVTALVGDVAVSIAVNKLEKIGVKPKLLECKVNWKRVD